MDPLTDGVNLLFASAGRRVELLRAFEKAMKALGLRGRIIALDNDPLAPALQVADRSYIVPLLNSPEFNGKLVKICRKEKVTAVFPLIDPDIPVLSANRAAIEQTGARLAVSPSEAVTLGETKTWCAYACSSKTL